MIAYSLSVGYLWSRQNVNRYLLFSPTRITRQTIQVAERKITLNCERVSLLCRLINCFHLVSSAECERKTIGWGKGRLLNDDKFHDSEKLNEVNDKSLNIRGSPKRLNDLTLSH